MNKMISLYLLLCVGVINGASQDMSGIPIMNQSGLKTLIHVTTKRVVWGMDSYTFLHIHEQNKMMYLPKNSDELSASSVGLASKENLEGSERLIVTPELREQLLSGGKYIIVDKSVDKSGKRFVLKIVDAKLQAEQKKEAGKKPEQKK